MKVLVTLSLLVSASFCAQKAPGYPWRPILSDTEAALFTKTTYLQGWTPPKISTTTSDYTVGGDDSNYKTIQAAVAAAIVDGGIKRKYIKINEGTYTEVVYIPPTKVPITLYGAGKDPAATVIRFNLSATTAGSAYEELFGSLLKSKCPSSAMYSSCANKTAIGVNCSSVVWVQANNVQIVNLTIENLSKRPDDNGGAVALYTQGDRIQVADSRILGHQNTFWSGATGATVSRAHVTNNYIEGDIDIVFGGGSTVFEGCTFYAKHERMYVAVIFSPATAATHDYGYLVINGNITGDWEVKRSQGIFLARAWDIDVHSSSTYIAGTSPNGQLVVRESTIDDIIAPEAVYASASSSKRGYAGNNDTSRNLNDHHFNRFWEYANIILGAN